MKVVHIDSGLGNQMLSYCEYLALKKLHPEEKIYIETIVYDIPECGEVTKQWNGYELERIFGIKVPNIRECFDDQQWRCIINDIKGSAFWYKNMNWPKYFTMAFSNQGINLKNIKGNYETAKDYIERQKHTKPSVRKRLINTYLGNFIKRYYYLINKSKFIKQVDFRSRIFYEGKGNILTGQWLGLKYIGNDIDKIKKEIEQSFIFPEFTNEQDIKMMNMLTNCNSVAIHARRGDMLTTNGCYYKFGYFKRAVKYIKKHVNNPVFVFFCDPRSIEWCKENEKTFNLDFTKDQVFFVDWNHGENSFRDMQLMSYCKHAVITNSTFGWWGAYFVKNPNKITISPEITINTTLHK